MQSATGVAPIGEKVNVTLQVVLGGSDGFLLGSDTKTTGYITGASPLGEPQRRALEFGKIRSGEYGTDKILFNDQRTIAVACSGADTTVRAANAIVETLDAVWGEFSGPIEELCLKKWQGLSKRERREALRRGENAVILVHSGKPQVFKIRFALDHVEPFVFSRRDTETLAVLGGDS